MSLMSCRGLTLGYEGKPVLRDLSFEVNEGEYLCVVGENGSGKTTLLKTLLRLKTPLAGSVDYDGGLCQKDIGYLPQLSALQKDFPASVEEIVLSGCVNRLGSRPFYGARERRLAAESLKKLGMDALSKRCFRELSGGQQRRVLLARALCAARKLLVLDEPAAGLDSAAAAALYDHIERINREDGLSIVMVTHDPDAVQSYASHVLCLCGGSFTFEAARGLHKNTEVPTVHPGEEAQT